MDEVLDKIQCIIKTNNAKIKLYKLDVINNDKIYLCKGIYKFFNWIFYNWIELTIKDIENITKFLSYLYYKKYLNISEYAAMFFGYVSIYLGAYEKYYYYWSNLAIKSKSYLAIKWAIEDYKNGTCKSGKINIKKAKELTKILQNLKVNFEEI